MIVLSNLLYHTGQRISPINFCPKTITHAHVNIIPLETDFFFSSAQAHDSKKRIQKICANAVTVCLLFICLFVFWAFLKLLNAFAIFSDKSSSALSLSAVKSTAILVSPAPT